MSNKHSAPTLKHYVNMSARAGMATRNTDLPAVVAENKERREKALAIIRDEMDAEELFDLMVEMATYRVAMETYRGR